MTLARVAASLAASVAALAAEAAVMHVAPGGFVIRHEAKVDAPPAKVYEALVRVGAWWNPEHSYSGDARNLSLDARAGGCFCEQLAGGGSVEHMRVVNAVPSRLLRLAGALGPLQAQAVAGSMTWRIAPSESGTRLELTYNVGGFADGGFDKLAPAVDGVLGEQFARLKALVETGSATPAR